MSARASRLWILSEVYYPEETGSAYYTTCVAEHWARRRSVAALTLQAAYSRAGVKAPRHEWRNGVEIIRCRAILPHGKSIFERLARMATGTVSLFFNAIIRIKRDDCMYVLTNPPSLAMLAPLIAWTVGIPYVLQVCDMYPEIMVACGLTREGSICYRILKWLSRLAIRRAARVVAVGRDMQEKIQASRAVGAADDVKFIPWWADSDQIEPCAKNDNPLARKLGLADKFVVLYAGNMGYPQNVEDIAAAVTQLADDPEIHFVFIGFGSKRPLLEGLLAKGAKNLSLLDVQPRSAQNDFLNVGDVGLVSLIPGMDGLGVPSRIYNLMAAGKPVIALTGAGSEIAQVIREHDIGWIVEKDRVNNTVAAIRMAKADRVALRGKSERARAAAETRFSRQTVLASFDTLIDGLV